MGGRKKSDDGDDGLPKIKKPNNFWAPFNTWWREHHERTGNRATVLEMRQWYAQNAHTVWPPDMMPSVEDMLKIAKGLRTIKQVQAYFRSYRRNLKTRKEGDPLSPDGGIRKAAPRRHPGTSRGVGGMPPGSFLAAVHQAAQLQQHLQYQPGSAGRPGCSGATTLGTQDAQDSQMSLDQQSQLQFMEWGFASEAAAAAAMEAVEAGSDDDEALADSDGEGGVHTSVPGAEMDTLGGTGAAATSAMGGSHGISGGSGRLGSLSLAGVTHAGNGGDDAAGGQLPAAQQPYFDQWVAPHAQPHMTFLPQAIAHRIVKSVRTSVGGSLSTAPVRQSESSGGAAAAAAAAAVFNSVGGGAAGPGMQAVTCRRTRVARTSAGGVWQQEVVEQLEVGVTPTSPLPYGLAPLAPYPGMPLPGHEDAGFPGAPHMPSTDAIAWSGRSCMSAGCADGANCAGGSVASGSAAPMADSVAGAMQHVPAQRKQLRCIDRGLVSVDGGELPEQALPTGVHGTGSGGGSGPQLMLSQQQPDSPPAAAAGASEPGPLMANGARRLVQSYGGHYPGYPASGLRPKVPYSASGMAYSDGGGSAYGAPLPPHPHAHMAAGYRGPAGAYGGMPVAWPHHHPHAAPPPHHHPAYMPYHMYGGYRHPHMAYSHVPPYGYAPHPAPAGYSSMPPSYHVPMPYHPYGMPMHAYGQYYPAEVAAAGADPAGPVMAATAPAAANQLPERPVASMPRPQEQQPMRPQQQQHPQQTQQPRPAQVPQSQAQNTQPAAAAAAGGGIGSGSGPVASMGAPSNFVRPAPQPLQLSELPPEGCGMLLGGTLDSLSPSTLNGLSGLSGLVLAESDAEGEEAASAAGEVPKPAQHQQLQDEGHAVGAVADASRAGHSPAGEARLEAQTCGPEEQVTGLCRSAHGAESLQDVHMDEPRGAVVAGITAAAVTQRQEQAEAPSSHVPISACVPQVAMEVKEDANMEDKPRVGPVLHPQPSNTEGPAAMEAAFGGPFMPPSPAEDATVIITTTSRHAGAFRGTGAAATADAPGQLLASFSATGSFDVSDLASLPTPRSSCGGVACPGGGGGGDSCTISFPGSTTVSEGGGAEGTANVYFKTPKVAAVVKLECDQATYGNPATSSDATLPHPYQSAQHQALYAQQQGLQQSQQPRLRHDLGASDGAAAAAAAAAEVQAEGPHKPRYRKSGGGGGAPVPVTVHVLQEEVLLMPHLASLGSLGDIAALHSPSGSLSLGLLEQQVEDGGVDLGMWGSCAQ
ncbi:hypothetical protein Agub_g3992 [Astrephomene gubernaculifera]|uniref:Uncharacterized protein n=1 Tax=Astrephomene gubernaculifera TaxID=47775 RepID=A0AAD3HJI4_9CHLO|nr:hypothetical protein Agub_g3992 [Astrephomene gubernaculifera]